MLSAQTSGARGTWSPTAIGELASLAAAAGCEARRDEPLARHTSMGVGGPTPLLIWPRRAEHLVRLAGWIAERDLPWRILGGGTNLLVGDAGVAEPVIGCAQLTSDTMVDGDAGHFPAGLPTARALRMTLEAGRDGLVWAAGLPGTIGGAAAGNAGCWGGEMGNVVTYLDVVDAHGRASRLPAARLRWDYRALELPAGFRDAVIVGVGMRLQPAPVGELRERYEGWQELKRQRQPVGARNAGCIFRNPEPGRGAGALLDQAGCKGMRCGDAEISSIHANFIVNRGAATSDDVQRLLELAQQRVRERFGVSLQPEIRRW